MKKALRKLIPTLVMVMITASMVGTSTFAWFSMNNKVTVTGMQVTTKVGDNLLISATSDENPTDNTDYQASMVKTDINALLEPVSSISGLDTTFYYTSTTNVKNDGDALDEIYVQYNAADTSAFNTNYGTVGAVGYADYVFTLKAMNSGSTSLYLDVTQLALHYGSSETAGNDAFRVAILAREYNEGGSTYGSYASKTVLKTSTAAYHTTTPSNSAVTSTSELAAVATLGSAATIATLDAGATKYYEVTVRLWLEGEDTDCTSDTFKALTDTWQLDLTILLQNATNHASNAPVTEITAASASRTVIAGDTITATTKVINGVTYKQLETNSTLYTTEPTEHLTKTSRIYTIADGVRPVDVTNQYRTYYIVTIVNNATTDTITVDGTFDAYYGNYTITATGLTTANTSATCSPAATTVSLTADTITITNIAADTTITLADVTP